MPKKIALALEHFSRRKGGAESFALALAETLVDRGWEVHLLGLSWEGLPQGAVFHRIALPRPLPTWLRLIIFARNHRRLVREADFDIILGFGNTIMMNVYQSHGGVHRLTAKRLTWAAPNLMGRLARRFLVHFWPKYLARHWIESAPFRINPRPRMVAVSDLVKKDLVAYHRASAEEIEVVYNGVETSFFNPESRLNLREAARRKMGLAKGETVFVFLGRPLRKKGLGPLLEAAGRLAKSVRDGFRVVVAGERPGPAVVRRTAALGLKEKVVFMGPTGSPLELYAAGDVFVLPTFSDACSLVVIEALACGLPVITTSANGAAGLIEDGRSGFVISHPPQPRELAARMEVLLDQNKRDQMSSLAAAIGRKCGQEASHDRLLGIFEEVMAGGPN